MKLLKNPILRLYLLSLIILFIECQEPNLQVAISPNLFTKIKGFDIMKFISKESNQPYVINKKDNEFMKNHNIEEVKIKKASFPKDVTATTNTDSFDSNSLNLSFKNMNISVEIIRDNKKYSATFEIYELFLKISFKKGESPKLTEVKFNYNFELTFPGFFKDYTVNFSSLLDTIFNTKIFKNYVNKLIDESLSKEIEYTNRVDENTLFFISNVPKYFYPYIALIKNNRRFRKTKSSKGYLITNWYSTYLNIDNQLTIGDIFNNQHSIKTSDYTLTHDIGIIIERNFLITAIANFISTSKKILGQDLKINLDRFKNSFVIEKGLITAILQIDKNGKSFFDLEVKIVLEYVENQLKINVQSIKSDNFLANFIGKITEAQKLETIENLKKAYLKFNIDEYLNAMLKDFSYPVKVTNSKITLHTGCVVFEVNIKVDDEYIIRN